MDAGPFKTLIGKLFHVGYTIEGTSKLLRRRGWLCQRLSGQIAQAAKCARRAGTAGHRAGRAAVPR